MLKLFSRYLIFSIIAVLFMVGEVISDLFQPTFMSKIVDEGILNVANIGSKAMSVIVTYSLYMLLVVFIGGLCGCLCNYFVQLSSQNFGNCLRKTVFDKILSLGLSDVERFSTGSLITRITNDISQIERLIAMFSRGLIRTSVMMIGSIVFMFNLSTDFGFLVVCSLPVLMVIMILCILRANPLFLRLQTELDALNSTLLEDLYGIRVIKAYVMECYEKLRFGKLSLKLLATQLRILVFFAFMNPLINALMNIVVAILILEGGNRVALGSATPGGVMAAITYTAMLINSIMMLLFLSQAISRGLISWKRVGEILNTPSDIIQGELLFSADSEEKIAIEFDRVSFIYPKSHEKSLNEISFKVRQGEFVAIMGPTGSGKTTLLNLIPRLYDPEKGTVKIMGRDIREYRLDSLREAIAYAPQKIELFSRSVAENISFSSDINDPNLREAAANAEVTEFIDRKQEGFEYEVSSHGQSLSGGQRQRVSLSRALYRNAPILLLDDVSSALDLITEAKVLDNIRTAYRDTTILMVAQRISSVLRADRIILLDEGRVVGEGSHEELLKTNALYQEIYSSQYGEAPSSSVKTMEA